MVYGDLFTKKEEKSTASQESAQAVVAPKRPPAEDADALMVALLSVYEPGERINRLQEGLDFWPDNEALKELQSFFDLRYKKVKTKLGFADLFLSLLVESLGISGLPMSFSSDKELTKSYKKNLYIKWQSQGTNPSLRRELFFGECMQMLGYYVWACRSDKNYASGLMGLLKAKPEQVERKLERDLTLLQNKLESAEISSKHADQWSTDMKVFRTALSLFISRL